MRLPFATIRVRRELRHCQVTEPSLGFDNIVSGRVADIHLAHAERPCAAVDVAVASYRQSSATLQNIAASAKLLDA